MTFKMHEIRELIRLIDESQIEEFQIENGEAKVTIKKASDKVQQVVSVPAPVVQEVAKVATPAVPQVTAHVDTTPVAPPVAATPVEEDDANLHKIVSPMVGTFYRAPSPESPTYVEVGDTLNEKTIVCIVEAMKLMNEIEAEVKGTVVKVLVENGQLVEYGQPLFLVKTS